jgi:plastocyanin
VDLDTSDASANTRLLSASAQKLVTHSSESSGNGNRRTYRIGLQTDKPSTTSASDNAAPGTYEYFCPVHPHMTGQIIVK